MAKARKELFVHVGMGKTGTTALQKFFWANRKALSNADVHYPVLGVVSGAHHLLSPHIAVYLQDLGTYLKPEDWAPALTKVKESRILISSELMAWAAPELVQAFCTSLAQWFDLRIVFYLRRQDDLIMATYNQQIKVGTLKQPINCQVEYLKKRFDYLEKIAPWEACVGPENIRIRPYERGQFHEGDIRRDFLHNLLGIEGWEDFKVGKGNSNPRLSIAAAEYKRMLNNVIDDAKTLAQLRGALLSYSSATSGESTAIYSSQPTLSPATRREILATFAAMNAEIARKYLGREDGHLFLGEVKDHDEDAHSSWVEHCSPEELIAIHGYLGTYFPALLRKVSDALASLPAEADWDALRSKETLSRNLQEALAEPFTPLPAPGIGAESLAVRLLRRIRQVGRRFRP